jgi:valyl-tRNA synthetase
VVARENPGKTKENPSGEWIQDPDVLDTWFSSGLWPFSTLGWPQQTEDLKTWYPTSVMETGHDIIFFWVARMMMMGLHFMKDVPFKVVYLHAMVRDEKGEKMSKTKGNVIDPLDVIRGCPPESLQPALRNKYPKGLEPSGADALRFTLASLTAQGRDIKLSLERVEGYKAFSNKIWNASRFAMMRVGDDFKADGLFIKDRKLSLADRWILSRLNKAVAGTQTALMAYQFGEAASTLYQFLWREFCDWYIELSKGSLEGEDQEAKDSTRAVLVFCLDQILRLLHPFMPFITEELWHMLPITRPTESISIAPYPEVNRRLDDAVAEAEMHPVIVAIEGLRTIRGESGLNRSVKIEAHIQSSSPQTRALLVKWKAYLTPLAGLASLNVTEPGPKPPQSAAEINAEMEIYVPLAGVIDLAEERGRLQKEIGRVEGELGGLKKKLDNAGFVARAPAEVVEKDRARVAELSERIVKLNDNLKRIAPLEVKVAAPSSGGNVNLAEELKDELASISLPGPDQQVNEALDRLREGTAEGFTARDRTDLGVAYMSMGLVDDAVREFNKAKESEKEEAAAAKKPGPKKASKPVVKIKPAAKKAAPKKPAAKKPAAKKAASKKPAAKKASAKKAPVRAKPAAKSKAKVKAGKSRGK